jgi:hypothetical protein
MLGPFLKLLTLGPNNSKAIFIKETKVVTDT